MPMVSKRPNAVLIAELSIHNMRQSKGSNENNKACDFEEEIPADCI